jgi:hypothetical protein
MLYKAVEGGFILPKAKPIKAVLYLPENKYTVQKIEKKLCDFYIVQLEKNIHALPKTQKLDVVKNFIGHYST